MSEPQKGVAAIIAACSIWGLATLYYHFLAHVPALEMMAHRTIWTALSFSLLLVVQGRFGEVVALWRGPERGRVLMSSALISVNWFLFIWAISSAHAVEASLGYYIFPLMSVIAGVVMFHERPLAAQMAAVALAALAVLILTIGLGVAPWIALSLAGSFSAYAAVKKGMATSAVVSVTVEVLLISPIAVGVLVWAALGRAGTDYGWFLRDGLHSLVLPLAGVISGGPLILFSYGARRVRLVTSGLVQYLNPTLQLLSAIIVMGETITIWHSVALAMIWAALALYTAAVWREDIRRRAGSNSATVDITVN